MKLFEITVRRIDLYTYYVYAENAEAFAADEFYEVSGGNYSERGDLETIYIKEIDE